MVFLGVTEAAVSLHGLIRSLKASIRCQPLRHIGFGPTGNSVVQHPSGLAYHELCRVQAHLRFGQRKGHTLVFANWSTKNHPLVGVTYGSAQGSLANPQRFGGDQNTLGVQARNQILESFTLFPHSIGNADRQIVVDHLTGRHRVAANFVDRRNRNLVAL